MASCSNDISFLSENPLCDCLAFCLFLRSSHKKTSDTVHTLSMPSSRSCSLFNALHFQSVALMARLSSVGLTSKISTFQTIGRMSSSSLRNLTALRTCQSNDENHPSIHRLLHHNHRGYPRRIVSGLTSHSPNVCY